MNTSLLVKLLVGSTATAGALLLTLWQTEVIGARDLRDNMRELDIYVTEYATEATTTVIDTDLTEGKFQCRFKNIDSGKKENTPFDCKITKQTLDRTNNKKHFSYDQISELPISEAIKIATENDKIHKLTVVGQYAKKDQFATTALEIVSKDENPTAHGTVIKWFVVDKNNDSGNPTFSGSINYFLAKGPSNIDKDKKNINEDTDTDNYVCAWNEQNSNFKKCEIFDFAESNIDGEYSSLDYVFSKYTTKIETNHNYLIKLTETPSSKQDNRSQNSITFIKKAAYGVIHNGVKFQVIAPSIVFQDDLIVLKK